MTKISIAKKRKRARFVAVLVAMGILGLATMLVLRALDENLLFFVTPSDLSDAEELVGKNLRLGGLVANGSIERSENSLTLHFVVTDGPASVPVVFTGITPDLFREGQGVIAEGVLNAQGLFTASSILAKHDETYMPAEVAEALKERDLWQHDYDNPNQ